MKHIFTVFTLLLVCSICLTACTTSAKNPITTPNNTTQDIKPAITPDDNHVHKEEQIPVEQLQMQIQNTFQQSNYTLTYIYSNGVSTTVSNVTSNGSGLILEQHTTLTQSNGELTTIVHNVIHDTTKEISYSKVQNTWQEQPLAPYIQTGALQDWIAHLLTTDFEQQFYIQIPMATFHALQNQYSIPLMRFLIDDETKIFDNCRFEFQGEYLSEFTSSFGPQTHSLTLTDIGHTNIELPSDFVIKK